MAMRVLVIGLAPRPEPFLDRMLRGLSEGGVEVWVASRSPLVRTSFRKARLRRFRLGPPVQPLGRWFDWAAAQVGRLRRPVQARRVLTADPRAARYAWPTLRRDWDIVYIPWNEAAVSHLGLLHLYPTLVSCRGSQLLVAPHNPRRRALREGLTRVFDVASAVHCVSRDLMREACQYGLDPAIAEVIPPAVDPVVFSPGPKVLSDNGACFRIITTASLIWRKGLENALCAVSRLKDSGVNVRYEIVGNGPDRQRLLYTIDDLGLRDEVVLRGKLEGPEVVASLRTADAFLLASLAEGISNSVLEAMGCGLPVVTTNCGGMAEAVDDGCEGFVVPMREPATMAEALRKLAENRELARSMGEAARQRVLRDFTLSSQVSAFHALLKRTAARRPGT